jgi:hypothetical protein
MNGVTLPLPALLISYVYLPVYQRDMHRYAIRDWMLDSGAYSAWKSGAVIDLEKYIDDCHQLLASDSRLVEVIALDVIGDGPASMKNAQRMKDRGVNAMPVYHLGEDWGLLKDYCAGWDKVGLSCSFHRNRRECFVFYDKCFARHWPKKFHSFGRADEEILLRYPFHSADSTTWEMVPVAYGRWKSFGKMSLRGGRQNLRAEVEWYLHLEKRLQQRWRKEMILLQGGRHSEPLSPPGKKVILAPAVRLALASNVQRPLLSFGILPSKEQN